MLTALFATLMLGLQSPPKPNFTFVFLKSGPNQEVQSQQQRDAGMAGHLGNLTRLWKEGLSPAAGPFGDKTPLRGIVILRGDQGDARKHFVEDPFVKDGRLTVEAHPWFLVDDPFARVEEGAEMQEYGLMLLFRGPKLGDKKSEEARRLGSGHIEHLASLAAQGMVAAEGPFVDDGDLRGIVFFREADPKKAQQAIEKDPAVAAGWLRAEYHPLWMAKGIFKEPKTALAGKPPAASP